MKKVFILFSLVICFNGFSQKPEKIYGNARQHKSLSYYKEQSALWKAEVEKNSKDAVAWYNYYYANRNIMYNDTTGTFKERFAVIEKIVEGMSKSIPDSYEYNISKWQSGGNNPKLLPYLNKAVELGEGRVEHLDYMINQGELGRNIKGREIYSIKKFEAGQFSTGIIYYNYNVLAGLDKNAILITTGDNDTYPVWYLQALGIRKDVSVINLSLIQIDDYRDKLFKELGIEKWQKYSGEEMTEVDYERYRKTIISHIASNKNNFPVFVALTSACEDKYTKAIEDKLYLTGLAYLYSKKPFDNLSLLKKNMEQQYAFDYFDKSFYPEISPDLVKIVNGNYVVPFLTLYEHYKKAGNLTKTDWFKTKLVLISKGTEQESEVLKHFQAN